MVKCLFEKMEFFMKVKRHADRAKQNMLDLLLNVGHERAAAEGSKSPSDMPSRVLKNFGSKSGSVQGDLFGDVHDVSSLRIALKKAVLEYVASGSPAVLAEDILKAGTQLACELLSDNHCSFERFVKLTKTGFDSDYHVFKPYLRAWYNGYKTIQEDFGADVAGMDTPEVVRVRYESLFCR